MLGMRLVRGVARWVSGRYDMSMKFSETKLSEMNFGELGAR